MKEDLGERARAAAEGITWQPGDYIEGKGVYIDVRHVGSAFYPAGTFAFFAGIDDWRGNDGKRFSAPFKGSLATLESAQGWHGHNGLKRKDWNVESEALFYTVLERMNYDGEWFPPGEEDMAALYRWRESPALKDTFATGAEDRYWIRKGIQNYTRPAQSFSFADNSFKYGVSDTEGEHFIRPIRAEMVRPPPRREPS
jgi:hypothetical protein